MCYIIISVILILIVIKIYIKLTTGCCRSQTCLIGKTAIVTGANTGIGYYTAVDFAKRGARVILACRDRQRALEASEKIVRETSVNNIIVKIVDFASLQSVRRFADEIKATEKRLDILVNNAGCGGLGNIKTEDGLNMVMQVNYFAPFLLTNLLLDLLKNTKNSRVVNVASVMAKLVTIDLDRLNEYPAGRLYVFTENTLYALSKLCNIMFTIELAKRLKETTVTTYSLHPGVIGTEIWRNVPKILLEIHLFILNTFFKSIEEGAQTTIYCSVAQGIEKLSGEHFHDCHPVKRYKSAEDTYMATKLWDKTEELVLRKCK